LILAFVITVEPKHETRVFFTGSTKTAIGDLTVATLILSMITSTELMISFMLFYITIIV